MSADAAPLPLAPTSPSAVQSTAPIELSIVIPTLNEAGNVRALIDSVARTLPTVGWELIFVDDDSSDGTAACVREIAKTDRRVRCVQRIGRRGLASACIEGVLAAAADYVAVMDGDMQHDESILPEMLRVIRSTDLDLVVGSRYTQGGSVGDWRGTRASMSRAATTMSHWVCKQPLSDPMSGFFMIRRGAFEASAHRLSALGFKILLDIVASAPQPLKIAEVPYRFRLRHSGESKLDALVLWEFGMLLLDKTIGRYIPARFLSFAAVGAAGVLVHMSILTLLLKGLRVPFTDAQAAATVSAMVFNFWCNNVLTYRDRRLHGWKLWRGLATFMAACSIGALANVGIASFLFASHTQWEAAALAGIVVSAVWNYAVTQIYTWKKK